MKTISNLIKEILAFRKGSPEPGNISNNSNNTNNSNNNETETDESLRNPELDNSSARESGGTDQKQQESRGGATGSGGFAEALRKKEEEMRQAVSKAFEEGVIAGRNAKIEETFFPSDDDGIPHFHGNASPKDSSSDIFSLAREA